LRAVGDGEESIPFRVVNAREQKHKILSQRKIAAKEREFSVVTTIKPRFKNGELSQWD
jgi:hypothetical protein